MSDSISCIVQARKKQIENKKSEETEIFTLISMCREMCAERRILLPTFFIPKCLDSHVFRLLWQIFFVFSFLSSQSIVDADRIDTQIDTNTKNGQIFERNVQLLLCSKA